MFSEALVVIEDFIFFLSIIVKGAKIIASIKHVVAANKYASIIAGLETAIIGWNETKIRDTSPKRTPFNKEPLSKQNPQSDL